METALVARACARNADGSVDGMPAAAEIALPATAESDGNAAATGNCEAGSMSRFTSRERKAVRTAAVLSDQISAANSLRQ